MTCLLLTDGKSWAQEAHGALKEGAESKVQERHSQEACLAFSAASWEGSCSVKAFSKAGDPTSIHRGKREKKKLLLFLGNFVDLHGATERRNQGCKQHREAALPPLIFIWYLSVLGKDSQGCAEMTLNLTGISSIPSACRRPVNSSALFPAQ